MRTTLYKRLTAAWNSQPKDTIFFADGPSLELTAAADDANGVKRFDAVAYGGGVIINAGMGGRCVVDLAGVTVREGVVPILQNHDLTRVVGHPENIDVTATEIRAQGLISGTGPAATEVLTASQNGFPWSMSIGARVIKRERIARGATARVNGREFRGPLLLIRQAEVYELSMVALPGASDTSVNIAASHYSKETDMNFNEWLKANGFDLEKVTEEQETSLQASYDAQTKMIADNEARKEADAAKAKETIKASLEAAKGDKKEDVIDTAAELKASREAHAVEVTRRGKLDTICASYPDLHAKGITEGWDAERAEVEVFRASMADGPNIQVHGSSKPTTDVIEAALCVAGGLDDVEKHYDDKTLQAAHTAYKGRPGLQELILQAAYSNGYTGRTNFADQSIHKDVLKAAFSTTSLPGIFANTANKFLLAGFNHVESSWRSISAIGSVSDFKQVTRYRLTGDLTYDQLAPTGEIKHGQVGEESFTNQAVTYAKMMGITRVDQINDDLGALTAIPTRLGMGAMHKINDVFWTEFMDNASHFASGNNNYQSGAGTALSISSLTAAELLFYNQTDPDSRPLGLDPAILLVPNALFVTATQLMHDLQVRDESSGAGTAKYPTGNPHAGKFQVKRSSYLHNSNYTGYSALAWYLMADPAMLATIEMVFLNGKQVPTTDTAEADFNTLGIQMRAYIDFGVNKQETRAGVKFKGEA